MQRAMPYMGERPSTLTVFNAGGEAPFVHAMHDLSEVYTETEFLHWAQQRLPDLIPHEMMWCAIGTRNQTGLIASKIIKNRFPDACLAGFIKNGCEIETPVMRQSCLTGLPQIFTPGSDNFIEDDELENFFRYGLDNIAGVAYAERTRKLMSYFSVSRVPVPMNSVLLKRQMKMLAPSIHSALVRIWEHAEHMLPHSGDGLAALTPRERQVLEWVAKGKTNWEVAMILSCSEGTVKTHMQKLMGKLGTNSRATAATIWATHQPVSTKAPYAG